jgi:serine/threonine protein kinase
MENVNAILRSSGGDIIQSLMTRRDVNEWEICNYVRQMLLGLDYLHDRNIAHLGLTVSSDQTLNCMRKS